MFNFISWLSKQDRICNPKFEYISYTNSKGKLLYSFVLNAENIVKWQAYVKASHREFFHSISFLKYWLAHKAPFIKWCDTIWNIGVVLMYLFGNIYVLETFFFPMCLPFTGKKSYKSYRNSFSVITAEDRFSRQTTHHSG